MVVAYRVSAPAAFLLRTLKLVKVRDSHPCCTQPNQVRATVETLLTGRPMVVAYRVSAPTAFLLRTLKLVKVPHSLRAIRA
jgi:lipid A disaccharide synthetase